MSYGKMNKFAEIIRTHKFKDKEGFVKQGEHVLASVRVTKKEDTAQNVGRTLQLFPLQRTFSGSGEFLALR